MKKVPKFLPLIIIGLFSYSFYSTFLEHQEELENLKGQVQSLRSTKKKKEKEKKSIERFKKDIVAYKERIEEAAKKNERLQRQLPGASSGFNIFTVVKEISEKINLKDHNLKTTGEINKGFYIEKNYQFRGQGTYLQLLIFFESLARQDQIFNIQKVDYKLADLKQRGRFRILQVTIDFTSYVHNPNHKEERDVKVEEDKTAKKKEG